tara:strand:+ start:3721 stop:3987 length:267 start_codon:yes stop_codon:yes gene_type:complete
MANFKIEYRRVKNDEEIMKDSFMISNVLPETAAWLRDPSKEDWANNWALERLAKRNRAPLARMVRFGFEIISIEEVKGRRLKINRRKR